MKQIALLLLAAAIVTLFSTSCSNTVRGAGRDVEKVGDKIQKATN